MSAPARTAPASIVTAAAWLRPLHAWPQELLRALRRQGELVRVVLATVRGSAPREAGTVMLVGQSDTAGTIGGGALEWQAVAAARALLRAASPAARMQRLVLGTELAQCCGGVVELWLERYTRADAPLLRAAARAARQGPVLLVSTLRDAGVERELVASIAPGAPLAALLGTPRAQALPELLRTAGQLQLIERVDADLPSLWLYGAGHVGQALARILMDLPLRLTWVDSRAELLPAAKSASVRILHRANPVASVAAAPVGARFLVLTHSHALDYALCRSILERGDFAWAGLIGSQSKAARFRARLAREGCSPERIERLVCPIGVQGIASKWPAAIAVGVAAQLLRDLNGTMRTATLDPRSSSARAAAARPAAARIGCADARCTSCDTTW